MVATGSRWRSAVCTTEVIVVRAPKADIELGCGGAPLRPASPPSEPGGAPAPGLDGGTLMGKRYGGDDLEVLCTKAGDGTLTRDGEPLPMKQPKALPASD